MKNYEVIIIGAGAAGLMCAAQAAKRGRQVLVLDHANKPGKKILMSGGGRCNFTNLDVSAANFISHNRHFCKSALSRYTPWHFLELVQAYNIPYHEKTLGQLFCDNKARDILNMLQSECERYQAAIQMHTRMTSIVKNDKGFLLQTSQGNYQCHSLVIASGGLSIPTMGASAFGYEVAKQFGLHVWPTRAALVAFTLHVQDKEKYAALTGVSQLCKISCNGYSFKENLLFTHRGISGPAILQISSYWQPGDVLTIDLLPEQNIYMLLQKAKQSSPNKLLKNILTTYFPQRLLDVFLAEQGNYTLQQFTNEKLQSVAQQLHAWQLRPNNTEGYRTAEVTLGGVDCNEISSKTFASHKVEDLYFIGEVLDVTGWLGGYNFQWAWASAVAAAQAC